MKKEAIYTFVCIALMFATLLAVCLIEESKKDKYAGARLEDDYWPPSMVEKYDFCPKIDQTTTVSLTNTIFEKKGSRAASFPLVIPTAYLDDDARTAAKQDLPSSVSVRAAYSNLRPFCEIKHGTGKGSDYLFLSLTHFTGPADTFVTDQQPRFSDKSTWKILADASHPKYAHYYTYKTVPVTNELFIPKKDDLKTPYFVTCVKRKNFTETPELADCKLVFGYKGQLLVKAKFAPERLSDIPHVYSKSVQLLDSFSILNK